MKFHKDYLNEVYKFSTSYDFFNESEFYNYTGFHLEDILGDVFEHTKSDDLIKYLLDNAINLECKTNFGNRTPLHTICQYGSLEMIKYIINKGVDTESLDSEANTPFMNLCNNDNAYELIKWAFESKVFKISLEIKDRYGENFIDNIYKNVLQRLVDENIIKVREYGYALKYLENQTIEQCQDAIDCDPSNIKFVRDDLKRYFN